MKRSTRKKLKKLSHHVLHEARHARMMREDIVSPADIETLWLAEQTLKDVWESPESAEQIEDAMEDVVKKAGKVSPQRSYPRLRENIEILVVAICIAMGVRTYFIQPFKIPTGSMQPTLYGITVNKDHQSSWIDKPPFRYVKFILTGKRYVKVRAKQGGYVQLPQTNVRKLSIIVGDLKPQRGRPFAGRKHRFYKDMETSVRTGDLVKKGDVLAKGEVMSGDHIFVDKVRFNFTKPKRGQIVVFRTDQIDHPEILKTDHYIKRLAGMPGEVISIDPPYLVADGQRITEPYPFKRLIEETNKGYLGLGYSLAHLNSARAILNRKTASLALADDQFLPLGDNTNHSLDGRYFGGVPLRSVIGPAFAIYWPFNERWGRAR
jgi:signal peptidase I